MKVEKYSHVLHIVSQVRVSSQEPARWTFSCNVSCRHDDGGAESARDGNHLRARASRAALTREQSDTSLGRKANGSRDHDRTCVIADGVASVQTVLESSPIRSRNRVGRNREQGARDAHGNRTGEPAEQADGPHQCRSRLRASKLWSAPTYSSRDAGAVEAMLANETLYEYAPPTRCAPVRGPRAGIRIILSATNMRVVVRHVMRGGSRSHRIRICFSANASLRELVDSLRLRVAECRLPRWSR